MEDLPLGKLAPELLAGLLARVPSGAGVVVGPAPGRDVAVLEADAERYWLVTSDPISFATDEIGHYAVTVNANDIATAGGTPRFFLATLLLPERGTTAPGVTGIFEQIAAACSALGIAWVGGHTEVTHGLDRPIVVGTLIGDVSRDALVRNDGAVPGDIVLCTKGFPIEGCALLARERREALLTAGFEREELDRLSALLHDPGIGVLEDARVACGAARVHAMHDPTEGGIATALWELAEASAVGLEVDGGALPLLPEAGRLAAVLGADPLGLIASGALLIALGEAEASAVEGALASAGIACARIARVLPASAGVRLTGPAGSRPLPRFDQDEIARVLAGTDLPS